MPTDFDSMSNRRNFSREERAMLKIAQQAGLDKRAAALEQTKIQALEAQKLRNAGQMDVQGLRNTGQMDVQYLRNTGQMDTQGLRNTGQMDVQYLRNTGQRDVQDLRNTGQIGVQGLRNIGRINEIRQSPVKTAWEPLIDPETSRPSGQYYNKVGPNPPRYVSASDRFLDDFQSKKQKQKELDKFIGN